MVDYVVYGKIILDDIRLRGGGRGAADAGRRRAAGGVRGAGLERLGWLPDSLRDRSATGAGRASLRRLDADLNGWVQYGDIPTPHNVMQYDDDEYLIGGGLITSREDWFRLLDRPMPLPPAYEHRKAIHLVTEFPHEPMVETALGLRERGAVFSLEPLAGSLESHDFGPMLELIRRIDLVTPDWPTASQVAGQRRPEAGYRPLVHPGSGGGRDPARRARVLCVGPGAGRGVACAGRAGGGGRSDGRGECLRRRVVRRVDGGAGCAAGGLPGRGLGLDPGGHMPGCRRCRRRCGSGHGSCSTDALAATKTIVDVARPGCRNESRSDGPRACAT